TAFCLTRRRAACKHLVKSGPCERRQLVFARATRRFDRFHDATPVNGNLGIGSPGQAALQLMTTVAGEDEVRVRIDEAWYDRAAACVETRGVRSDVNVRRPPLRGARIHASAVLGSDRRFP